MNQLTVASKTFPSSMTSPRLGLAAAAVNGKLCAVGGRGSKDSIEICDVVNGGRWTQAPSKMSRGRYGFAAVAIGNSVFVAGGNDGGSRLKSAEAFDIETGLWRTLPSMSTPRVCCAGVAVGDEFFVFGGYDASGRLNTAESFDVKTGQWKDLPPMNTKRGCFAAVFVDNKIYVVGGQDVNGLEGLGLDTVEVFDLTTRTWTLLPHLMTTGRFGCATAAVGRYLLVAKGHDGTSILNTVDIDGETWRELPPMSTKRHGCAAVSLGGSVYVLGGEDENYDDEEDEYYNNELDSVEEIRFSDNVIQGMLVEWSGGTWRNDVLPLLHRRGSVVHKLDIDITLMPTLLSRVGQGSRVLTVYEILRGQIEVVLI